MAQAAAAHSQQEENCVAVVFLLEENCREMVSIVNCAVTAIQHPPETANREIERGGRKLERGLYVGRYLLGGGSGQGDAWHSFDDAPVDNSTNSVSNNEMH